MNQIKEDLNKLRNLNAHWLEDLILLRCQFFPNCSINLVQLKAKSHQDFFHRNWQADTKIYKEIWRNHIYSNSNIWKKRELVLLDFRVYSNQDSVMLAKIQACRLTEQNRKWRNWATEIQWIDVWSGCQGNSVKSFQQIIEEQLYNHMQEKKLTSIYNVPNVKICAKYIIDLKIKHKTWVFLYKKECGFWWSKYALYLTLKVWFIIEKIVNKNICYSKNTVIQTLRKSL